MGGGAQCGVWPSLGWRRWARGKCCVLCEWRPWDGEASGADRKPASLLGGPGHLMGDMEMQAGDHRPR